MTYFLGIGPGGDPVYSLGHTPEAEPIDEPNVVEVTVTGFTDCDLCTDHFVWECPGCEDLLEHFQYSPLDVTCRCGAVSRIAKAEHKRWRRDVLGVDP